MFSMNMIIFLFFSFFVEFSLQAQVELKPIKVIGSFVNFRNIFSRQKFSKVYIDCDQHDENIIENEQVYQAVKEEFKISELTGMMTFDSFFRYSLSEKFLCRNEGKDQSPVQSLLSGIFDGFESLLLEFLAPVDVLNFRLADRRCFLAQIISSRSKFYKLVGSSFTKGFECLNNHSLSAYCLNQVIIDVSLLTNVPLKANDDKHDLKVVLNRAIYYYRKENKNFRYKLMEAMLKGKVEFDPLTKFFHNSFFALYRACQFNLIYLGKTLILNFSEHLKLVHERFIYKCCYECLRNDSYTVFRLIMLEFIVEPNLRWRAFRKVFKTSIRLKKYRFTKLMLEFIPFDQITTLAYLLSFIPFMEKPMRIMLLQQIFSGKRIT